MGLHDLSEETNTVHYHCTNPNCGYHNCQNWDAWQTCTHHDTNEYVTIPAAEMRQRMQGILPAEHLERIGDTILMQKTQAGRTIGQTQQIPVDHPGIEWMSPEVVALPPCDCGTRMFLKVKFTDEELTAPNIQIPVRDDPTDPTRITRIDEHPMVARHQQLAALLTEIGNVHVPAVEEEQPPAMTGESLEEIMLAVLADQNLSTDQGLSTTAKMPAIRKQI